jgi:hypothetical protein
MTLLVAASYLLTTCSKNNDATEVLVKDRPNINRTINYTVLVVAGETAATNSTIKSAVETTGATGAVVQVAVNGTVLSKTTDISGQATFTNLVAGIAAVTVELANHTTVNYVVDLYHIDTIKYDNETKRMSSTKVVVFPTSGAGMITVSGLVNLRTDITVSINAWSVGNNSFTQNTAYSFAPSGTIIAAEIPSSELGKYVTMLDGGGSLTDVTYEGVSFTATVDAGGKYTLSVPSTAMGLGIDIQPEPIVADVTYSVFGYANDGTIPTDANGNYRLSTATARNVYRVDTPYTIKAYTGKNEIVDIKYNNPTVTDSLYFH